MYQKGRAWIELDINNLAQNLKQFQKLLPANCAIMPALKANAYGHGANLIGNALQELGIKDFCVASVNEAIELRKAGITGQILVLGYTSPYRFSDLIDYKITQTVIDLPYAKQLNDYGYPLYVHVGVDTGMHRLGERSENIDNIFKIWDFHNLKVTGIYSHLCVSDGDSETEKKFTMKQVDKFNYVIESLHQRKITGFKTHIQGSYGVLNYPFLKYDYARLGIALYGCLSSTHDRVVSDINLLPVLSLKSRVECIRFLHSGESLGYGLAYTAKQEMKVATVSIGYADGVPRILSNKGIALLNGYEVRIIGRICMDQLLLDISNVFSVSAGDEVIFIGKSGNKEISASQFAKAADTISNEVLSRLGSRLERISK